MNIEDAKILIFTVDCWNDRIGANTMSELFSWCNPSNIANIYIRSDVPTCKKCSNYFQICENKVIKSIINPKQKTGKRVLISEDIIDNELSIEKKRYKRFGNKRLCILLYMREILWLLGRWKSKELDEFLMDFNPDVIVFSHEGYIHFNRLVRYSIKKTNAKAAGYFWDDNFTFRQHPLHIGLFLYRIFQRRDIRKSVKLTDLNFAIMPKTKKECDAVYNIDSVLLTKPVNNLESIQNETEHRFNEPIQLLYTGNLGIGRIDTIVKISYILNEINNEKTRIVLDVYTKTFIPAKYQNKIGKYVRIHDAVPQEDVIKFQKKADILLLVESLKLKYRKIARLSFSTKIVDYLGAGKCIVAVGDKSCASMEYLEENNAALVANNYKKLKELLYKVVENRDIINRIGENAREVADKNHSYKDIISTVKSSIERIL